MSRIRIRGMSWRRSGLRPHWRTWAEVPVPGVRRRGRRCILQTNHLEKDLIGKMWRSLSIFNSPANFKKSIKRAGIVGRIRRMETDSQNNNKIPEMAINCRKKSFSILESTGESIILSKTRPLSLSKKECKEIIKSKQLKHSLSIKISITTKITRRSTCREI